MSANPTLSHAEARRFYDRFGARQDAQAFYEDAAVRTLCAHADFEHAGAVVEFGCGTGRLAERLLSGPLPERARYLGLDLSTTMVGLALERTRRFGSRVEIRQSQGEARIEAPDGAFDRFVSTYVLDLLSVSDVRAVLAEAHRLLAPGGLLCLAGLTEGTTVLSRALVWGWTRLHRLRPAWVGGCRPLRLRDHLPAAHWEVRQHAVVTAFAVPSEVLVAARREPE